MEEKLCPTCRQTLVSVGDFWICPGHGQVTPGAPHAKLKIFLSYGHDSNEELVRRIRADLEARGHDVWFDKSEIKFGDDWRRSITDGIAASNRVLSFLSKYSTRDPGVCLDEIAIAIGVKGGNIQTILVESESEVKPPPTVSHTQWLDMHDWKEQRTSGEAPWESWYQSKLSEIVRVVESPESVRFAGEIEKLSGYLKPISSDSRISALLSKGFVGREWLFKAVENWRTTADRSSRLFWITGEPGVGKSVFAAQLTHFGRDKVVAAQFVEWDKPDHRDARRVICSLAFQLATRLPDYRKLLLTLPEIGELENKRDSAELFEYLLANPLKSVIDGGRERFLIIIDALDEAGDANRNLLVEMLARHASQLPAWLGIVATSRPEIAVTAPLQGLHPEVLDTGKKENREDIRAYLRHNLARQLEDHTDASSIVEQITSKSEGVFLYAERFCEDVGQGHLSLEHHELFPQGLGGVYYQYFQRQFSDLGKFRRYVRPALRTILAACEPLPVEILQSLFNWQEEELHDFTRALGSLFTVTTRIYTRITSYDASFPHLASTVYATPRTDPKVIKAYHKSLVDWITDEDQAGCYFVSVKDGHRALAEFGFQEFRQTPRAMSPYSICNLPQHLAACGDGARLRDVLNDEWFLEHSPVYYADDFYNYLAQFLPPQSLMLMLTPAFSFFAERAKEKSPKLLGYTLFPHEPGVIFDGGTPVYSATDTGAALEYTIPRNAREPSKEVLYDFVKCCNSTFLAVAAFLRGVPDLHISEWYCDYWNQSGLQATLDDIDRYYDSCWFSLAHRAGYLSWQIDEAARTVKVC